MKNLKAFFLPLIMSAIIPCYAEAASNGIDFSIRFFDRRIYYVSSDPIKIQITITNNSPSTYRFKLADDRVFSIDFDVRTVTNRALNPADILIQKRTQYQQIFFREIAVEPFESFSFVEDLRDYVRLDEPGSFVVKARVYPELFRHDINKPASVGSVSADPAPTLESQRLNLSLRPPVVTDQDGIPLEMDIATGAVLVRERIAPDQVVEYMISARQKSQWERFFLYLDLEAMLSTDSVLQRRWLAESEEGRRRMIELYRQELRNSELDGTISIIPSEFTIERTQYNNLEGTVTVLEKFRNNYFTEVKRYTYFLKLKDNIWNITGYSVVNLGTE